MTINHQLPDQLSILNRPQVRTHCVASMIPITHLQAGNEFGLRWQTQCDTALGKAHPSLSTLNSELSTPREPSPLDLPRPYLPLAPREARGEGQGEGSPTNSTQRFHRRFILFSRPSPLDFQHSTFIFQLLGINSQLSTPREPSSPTTFPARSFPCAKRGERDRERGHQQTPPNDSFITIRAG